MPTTEKTPSGRYITNNLDHKQAQKVFKKIQSEQNANRRKAKNTLTAGSLTRKSIADLIKLGGKQDGTPFTKDDLLSFEKARNSHKEQLSSKNAGVKYSQLIANSRGIDVKRSNNSVNDGSGITKALLSGIKSGTILVRVKASSKSVHQEHMVKLRMDQYDDYLQDPPAGNYKNAAKEAAKGRLSIDCDCGRHQYWYRYMATAGNYCVAPPKEFSFPKIRNPELRGLACKHVLKAAVMLQSAAWQNIIARQMEIAANKIGFGDDRKLNHILNDKEIKEAAKNRSTKINHDKVKMEWLKYQRSNKGLAKKLKTNSKEIDLIRKQANKIRKQANKIKSQSDENKMLRDMFKMNFSIFEDKFKAGGGNRSDAIKAFAKEKNFSIEKLKQVLK